MFYCCCCFYCLVGCFNMIVWTPAVLSVLYLCVLYFCICPCSAQLSMFHMERHSRTTLIIIIIMIIIIIVRSSSSSSSIYTSMLLGRLATNQLTTKSSCAFLYSVVLCSNCLSALHAHSPAFCQLDRLQPVPLSEAGMSIRVR